MRREPGSGIRISDVGNTALFVSVLLGLICLMVANQYTLALCVAAAGIYAELWNIRVSFKHPPPPCLLPEFLYRSDGHDSPPKS